MNDFVIKSIEEFESYFYRRIRGLDTNKDNIKKRIQKFYELVVLKENASPLGFQQKEIIRRISVVLTTNCNLKCVWCHREEKHVIDSGYLSKNLNRNKIEKLLPELKGFHVLSWGGLGEPLMNKDIYELTKIARKYIPIVKTTSNGTTLVKKNIPKIIESGLNYLEVSIDGFDSVANLKLRGSDENVIIENLINFSDSGNVPLQINSVVSEENYESLMTAIEKLRYVKNIICIHAIPLFMTKHMENLGIKRLSHEKFEKLLTRWKNDIKNFKLDWIISPDLDELTFDPVVFLKEKHNICFTPFEDPTINVDGEIVPCSRLQHLGLGNVFDNGFEKVWNGKKMIKFREEQLKGNYGDLCQRECDMKVTTQMPIAERTKILQTIHPSIKG
jgi:radical SAM protein with 4Fe4S-binding SPASM domain